MKKLSLYRRIFSLFLCLALFMGIGSAAFADNGEEGVIDPDALQQLVDDFVTQQGLDPKNFSVGYVYTATGEEWYYNPDTWYYPASMYKVPLMMTLAEKVSSGDVSSRQAPYSIQPASLSRQAPWSSCVASPSLAL